MSLRTTRTVIVGNGMAATCSRSSWRGSTRRDEQVHPAYNRIAVGVLEGTHPMSELTLRKPGFYETQRGRRRDPGWDGRTGRPGRSCSTTTARLLLRQPRPRDRQHPHPAARPRPRRAAPNMRSAVCDCRGLVCVPLPGAAVVVGAGGLGLQVARALAIRGLKVEVVEGTDHVLSNNVGSPGWRGPAGQPSKSAPRSTRPRAPYASPTTGCGWTTGTHSTRTSLCLPPADSVDLARRAGLMVRRGIVVDAHLRSVLDENSRRRSAHAPSTAVARPASCRLAEQACSRQC